MASNVTYEVVGRYMSGPDLTGYHLISSDGRSIRATKSMAILLIGRGQVTNMRVQYSGEEVIIRGKGINLNKLPVYDINKETFRNGAHSQPNSIKNKPKFSQYNITKRIMYQTACVGYIITDNSGNEIKINRQRAYALATNGLILNAEAQKYKPKDSDEPKIILRGIGIDLKSLPTIFVDKNGEIINKNEAKVYARITQIRRSGILYNEKLKTKKLFNTNDYIVCTPSGELTILKNEDARLRIKIAEGNCNTVLGDNYIANVFNYSVEFLGGTKRCLTDKDVYKWPVCEIKK